MGSSFIPRIDRALGIAGTDAHAMAVIEERLAALQPRMPWLYAMMVSCLIGMIVTFEAERKTPLIAIVFCLLTVLRGVAWIRLRKQVLLGEDARRRLRTIGIASVLTIAMFAVVIVQFLPSLSPEKRQLMLLMTATCTIALAMPMATLPASARSSYALFGIPVSLAGMLAGPERAASVACFNLLMCNIILIVLLTVQDRSFVVRIVTRIDGDRARQRAERAERRAVEGQVQARAAAESDFLTGLPNRRAFLAAINQRASNDRPDTLMILDLDGFKPVNDTFGHGVGDELLKQVSQRLFGLCRGDMLVARLGGDEFALLTRGMTDPAARAFAEKVVAELGRPYQIGPSTIGIAACCGIAQLGANIDDPSSAIRQADLALYRAKAKGRGKIEEYESSFGDAVRRRTEIEMALRAPGVADEIELAFQPIYDLETMQITSFEALARWSHSTLGAVSPTDFIPITEQIQLVESISGRLLDRAARQALRWPARQSLSFNLSAVQLCSLGSAERVLEIIAGAQFPPARLQIEVTETAMLADVDTARINIELLRAAGVLVVLDDFGAGYASVGYLREMRFDKLKLDGSLLTACDTVQGAALLKGVIDLARAIGTPCIAEHVETMQQATLLRIIGCRFGQGYWLGRPVNANKAEILANAVPRTSPRLRIAS